ncbi:MAG: hypothetical protein V4578_01955 [Pseudomonadota bacterium]
MRKSLIIIVAAALLSASAQGRAAEPVFQQFPVAQHFAGRSAPLRLMHPRDREFRTALTAAARQPVNFAGHYVLTTLGCGASCILVAAIDARTGTVAWLPFTLCCWDIAVTEPVQFKLDSDLIVLRGQRDEAGAAGPHYWRLKEGQFTEALPAGAMRATPGQPARR